MRCRITWVWLAKQKELVMNKNLRNVDWAWANQLTALPIFEAVALSLGYELGTLPPIGFEYPGKPVVDVPEHRERTILAYDAARRRKLGPIESTSFRGEKFSAEAEFSDGQSWEIEVHEFRSFCDRMKWVVPKEFLPIGYEITPAMAVQQAGVGVAVPRVRVNGTPWTAAQEALLIVDFKMATGTVKARYESVAALWGIKEGSVKKQLEAIQKKAAV